MDTDKTLEDKISPDKLKLKTEPYTGLSDHSKKIKKSKKDKIRNSASTERKDKGNSQPLEEGEEGMLSEGGGSILETQSMESEHRPEMVFLNRFEKYPEYLTITVQRNPHFFNFTAPLSKSN